MWLNITWFVLYVAIIGGYVILDGFDLGVGMLSPFLAKNDTEKRLLLNSIGPVWDGNEVWLVLGGGALFAAFPLVYASLFSGFYLAMMLVLLVLILRTIAIEFRSKKESPLAGAPHGTGSSSGPPSASPCCSEWHWATSSEEWRSTSRAT